jgi:Ca2+/H+ antiporter
VFAIPCCSNIPGLENYGIITGIIPIVLFFGVIFLIRKYVRTHNQKIDKEFQAEQEKKEAELQAKADKEKANSQIWVIE